MKKSLISCAMMAALVALTTAAVPARADAPMWKTSTGNGFKIFGIEDQGFSLYVRCPEPETSGVATKLWKRLGGQTEHSSVNVAVRMDPQWLKPLQHFKVSVQGRDYDGPIDTASKESAARLVSLVAALRQAPATVTVDGKPMVVPVNLAAQTIPDPTSLGTVCKLD